MSNLRILEANAADSRTIKVRFSDRLTPSINHLNVIVEGVGVSTPNAKVKSAVVSGSVFIITVLPLTPYSEYKLTFFSNNTVKFSNEKLNSFLIEDGVNNTITVLGAENPDNTFRNNLVSGLEGQPYNPDKGTLIRHIFNQMSDGFVKARSDIKQLKNENYLNVEIKDERKRRGFGPFDRLNEEGAFEVTRVGLTLESQELHGELSFDSFPFDVVSLQSVRLENERILPGQGDGTFDGLLISTKNQPIIKLNSLTILYEDGSVFNYDIRKFGYQLKDSKYDSEYASTFVQLKHNQIKLNEQVIDADDFKIPGGGDEVIISYDYKHLGIIINEESVNVSQVLDSIREATPPLSHEFSLKHFPIVTVNDNIGGIGDIVFLDTESENPFQTIHPAFINEIPFDLGSLPRNPGEYSINYETGRVFVYGAVEKDGTGPFPPAATYKYRKSFRKDLDYTFDSETYDLVASPLRDLPGKTSKISFLYEKTLIPNVDFKALVHKEVLTERIGNNILSANSIRVKNAPITNVFRIFNETSGESYGLTRFNNDIVYFSSITPPSIQSAKLERASFKLISNEQLVISEEFFNSLSVRVFKIKLSHNNIMSASEDVVGSSYNTSVSFSRGDVFSKELFFDGQVLSEELNTDKLSVGDYQIDYRNGIVYVGVSVGQGFSIGEASYKAPIIIPNNPHIIAVSNIYNSVDISSEDISKTLNYSSFIDGEIYPNVFDFSDERFLNGDTTLPYIVSDDTITVSNDIRFLRNVFDSFDLLNSSNPINFALNATSNGNIIFLNPEGVEISNSLSVGIGLELDLPVPSNGISTVSVKSVVRISDNVELLDGYETLSGDTLTLSGSSGAIAGDIVNVIYFVKLNNLSTPIVDYDRGEYFIDYTYLEDEIIVSYEYGDNVLDFRESEALEPGQEYFVNYKVGALRDSLMENFGALINIPELNSFDIDLDREIYRNALRGALQSFTRGPTIPSMKDVVSSITKIKPEIIEAIFQQWSLGVNHLFRSDFILNGNPEFVSGRFNRGILFRKNDEYIKFPISSNLRLEEGTMEMSIIPEWNGIDNDATLTFSNLKLDGYDLSPSDIYIGSSSFNPEIINGKFSINRFDEPSVIGLPSAIFTNVGLFIYYDDINKKWNVLAKHALDNLDGYSFSGTIESSGEFYDVTPIKNSFNIDDVLISTNNKIDFIFNINETDILSSDGYSDDGYIPEFSFDGIRFMADNPHYLFDFGKEDSRCRFSLFKDGRGYLNFVVWDKGGGSNNQPLSRRNKFAVSADIQDWKAGEQHSVAISWKLNSKENRDELHLFIDGFEVPNIIRFGGVPAASSTNRFRTINPEVIVGTIPRDIVTSNTLSTIQGSDIVTSLDVDFGIEGILPGDTIEIKESGFGTYTIVSVNGNSLQLNVNMPFTVANARFTVNPFSAIVSSEVDIYKNIMVSALLNDVETEIPGLRADIPGYEISKNSLNQNILTILGNVKAGSEILIRTLGLNHRRCREKVYLWNNQAVLKTHLPMPVNLDEVNIVSVILPYTVIGPNNSNINIDGYFESSLSTTALSNDIEGRQLEIRISGGNVDFSAPTIITINGTSDGGPIEVLNFTQPGKQLTSNKWQTITSVDIVTLPISTSIDGIGVEIKEKFSVTEPNGNNIYPVIRFSYQTQSGLSLESLGGNIVFDNNGFFPQSDVGNVLVIESPVGVVGTYVIEEVINPNTVKINSNLPAFTDGIYKVYNVTIGRSGFQNGFFFLEQAGSVDTPYELPSGFYEFDYPAFLQVDFEPVSDLYGYIGSDFHGKNQAKAVIDEFRILSRQLTDTRVGETLPLNEESITTGALAIRPFRKNNDTLVLLHMDSFPIENDADYIKFANRGFIQSGFSINENFGHSIVLENSGLRFDNKGILNTKSEGTIEFWVSPKFDTYNDPLERVYFDASSSVVESVVSLSKGTVRISGRASEILSVRLATDTAGIGTNYFTGGSIASDGQTINLGNALPFQMTPVVVTYVPTGLVGDRLTIFKDKNGFISFTVLAGGERFEVRQPVFWARNTWHRVKATFKFNTRNNMDEIRLFVDGEERSDIRFGNGLLFGSGIVFGQSQNSITNQVLIANIDFKDPITQFFIGQDFMSSNLAQARMDNIRISDKALTSITIGGQQIDANYSSNINAVFPVIENAYTTFLLDFEKVIERIRDFSILRDAEFGIFNFDLNIIDSFRIVEESERVKSMLESMILALKPANSKVKIEYIR